MIRLVWMPLGLAAVGYDFPKDRAWVEKHLGLD